MNDPTESFSGNEMDRVTDAREAAGPWTDAPDDAAVADGVNPSDTDGLSAAGDAIMTVLEQDFLNMGPTEQWVEPSMEEFDENLGNAQAVSDILTSDWAAEDKELALQDLMQDQGRGIVEATQHLTGALTGTDAPQAANQDRDAQDNDPTSAVADEVGKVAHNSKDAASMLIGALRTNVGVSAVGQTAAGFINS